MGKAGPREAREEGKTNALDLVNRPLHTKRGSLPTSAEGRERCRCNHPFKSKTKSGKTWGGKDSGGSPGLRTSNTNNTT